MYRRDRSMKFQTRSPESSRSLRSGDIIGVISRERNGLAFDRTCGLALPHERRRLHFMHASSPRNYGKVVVDDQLSKYLYRYGSDSGILVGRPLR